jgi:hypothetical protein
MQLNVALKTGKPGSCRKPTNIPADRRAHAYAYRVYRVMHAGGVKDMPLLYSGKVIIQTAGRSQTLELAPARSAVCQ